MNYSKYGRNKKKKEINSKNKKLTNFFNSTIFKSFIIIVVVVGLVGLSLAYGAYKAIIDSAPKIDDMLTAAQPEEYKSIIYDLNGNEVQQLSAATSNRIYVDYDQIPKQMIYAIVSIEDERFFKHNGFDLEGFIRAAYVNLKNMNFSQGGSTLTQQVVKMNLLKDSTKKIERKLQEQHLAVEFEKKLTEEYGHAFAKQKILELYLNSAPFGRASNGVQTAAQTYFNKDISEITIAEAAVIAGITNAPTKYDPIINPENNRNRQRIILKKMKEQGYISDQEYQDALEENVYDNIKIINQQFNNQTDHSYFVDETIQRVAKDLSIQKGYTEGQAYNLIYRGGLSIYITQDLKMQEKLDLIFNDDSNFPPPSEDYEIKLMYSLSTKIDDVTKHHYKEQSFKTKDLALKFIDDYKAELGISQDQILAENSLFIPQPQAAMVVLDYYTGHIKAMVGGRGQKIGNQTFNRATQAVRQPGSTFKIVAAYAPALDARGYTLATVIDDAPVAIKTPSGGTYSPKNWYRGYKGLSTIREGIAYSMNILAVQTTHDISPELAYEYLLKFGFTTLVENEVKNGNTYTDITLSLPLGGLTKGVTPLELTAAYGAIANQGVYIEPIVYTKVLDHDGTILLNKQPESHQVIKKTTAFLLTDAMVDVIKYGTGTTNKLKNMTAAGKTGTTTDTKDLWFAGYTPYYASVIWMGYDDPKTMKYYRGYHKYIWRDAMNAIHEGLPNKQFPVPEGIVQTSICTESGLLPAEGLCANDMRGSTIKYEYFDKDTLPTETCDVHKEVLICKDSGYFANEFCPPESIQKRVYIQRRQKDIPENWDPSRPYPVNDYRYQIPFSLIGEYCTIHGPNNSYNQDSPNKDNNAGDIIEFTPENLETENMKEPTPPQGENTQNQVQDKPENIEAPIEFTPENIEN